MSDQKEMSFLDHLGELRGHLIRSVIAIIIAAVFIGINTNWVVECKLVRWPSQCAWRHVKSHAQPRNRALKYGLGGADSRLATWWDNSPCRVYAVGFGARLPYFPRSTGSRRQTVWLFRSKTSSSFPPAYRRSYWRFRA